MKFILLCRAFQLVCLLIAAMAFASAVFMEVPWLVAASAFFTLLVWPFQSVINDVRQQVKIERMFEERDRARRVAGMS